MLTVVNKIDLTSYVDYESIKIDTVASDPLGKATFQIVDPSASLSIAALQEVIFIDEAATLGGNTLIPGHNYLNNNNFNFGAGSGATAWNSIGTLSGRIAYPSNPTFGAGALATLTFSNQAVGTALAAQSLTLSALSGKNYVIAGQTYCLSATVNVTGTFSNSYALLEIIFLDASSSVLSTTQSSHVTATGTQRISVQASAPTGTVTIQAVFGGATTSTTNSGTATFTALQLEPVWFPSLYSYPTPICDWLQLDCVTLPDGTVSRFDRSFCGNITHITVSYDGTTRIWDCEATSLDGWLENVTLINAEYAGSQDNNIIIFIIQNLSSIPIFASDGSPVGIYPQALALRNVPIAYPGVTVDNLQFADATLREIINALADLSGYLFGIDHYYNIYYFPPYFNAAPYGFVGNGATPDNVTSFAYHDYSIEYDATQLQTLLHVSGGTYETQTTESFAAGDGTHNQFITGGAMAGFDLTYPPAGAINIPQITFGGMLQTTAIDTGVGFGTSQTLLQGGDKGNNHIGIATGVTLGTSVSVTYTYDALVYVQCAASDYTARYGRRLWAKINDTNLISNASAATRGEAQLAEYAAVRTTLKFKTTKMLAPTQTIAFTSTLDGLTAAHYTVQKVTATYLGNGINQYEIEAGTYVADFVDFFSNAAKAINRADHDPNALLQQANLLLQDSLSLSDSLNIHT